MNERRRGREAICLPTGRVAILESRAGRRKARADLIARAARCGLCALKSSISWHMAHMGQWRRAVSVTCVGGHLVAF
eukprot:7229390-Prymnesium_polylepis.2